jgi:hypothetical protein
MEIVKLTKDKYAEWNQFCQESNTAWFWHTTNWQEYILSYVSEARPQKENISFMVYKKDEIVAVAPLICETVKTSTGIIKEFSFDGWRVPAPALVNNLAMVKKDEIYEIIFNEIDRLAEENGVKKARFGIETLSMEFLGGAIAHNYLMGFGYLDVSLNTQIIDLGKPEEELWKELRRNHRRNILKGGQFKITFFNGKNITEKIFNEYRKAHIKAAGRQVRPDKTYELMREWIDQDLAFLAAVEIDRKKIGFEYYSVYKNNAYGFSAANDPEYGHLPVRHFLEWKAILWMKQQELNFYEIGLQQYGKLIYDFPSEKQINISHFKKGFGGFTAPIFMGEKYYDKKYQQEIWQSRLNKFNESI